jgi:Alternative complex III, ActD subunit
MPVRMTLMGLFIDVGNTADALDKLRLLGLREEDMGLMMGVPYTEKMTGRPQIHERVPWVSILGALGGLVIALILTAGTQVLYPIRVGGRPLFAIPTSLIPIFELTMLGLMLGTFLNFLWKNGFPSTKPGYYDHLINYGRVALEANFDARYEQEVRRAMIDAGAERVYEPERRPL